MTSRVGPRPINDPELLRDVVYAECHDAIARRNPEALDDFRAAYRKALSESDAWWCARFQKSTHDWLRIFGVYLPSKRGLIPIRRCTQGPLTPPRRKRNSY